MKLLSVSNSSHDLNFSYFNGSTLRYVKVERLKQVKHFSYENVWEWVSDFESIFNTKINEVDHIALIADSIQYPYFSNIDDQKNNFVNLGNDFINPFYKSYFSDKIKKITLVNHHYAHSLSGWMLSKNPDVSFVIDGLGDLRTWSVYKNDELISCNLNSVENPFRNSIGRRMIDSADFLKIKSSHILDYAGKIMGIQSYGKINNDYLDSLKNLTMSDVDEIFSINRWIDFHGDSLVGTLLPLDWIATVHEKIGNVLVDHFKKFANEDDCIVYSGGVAQNIIWNTKLKKVFKNLIVIPHSGDDGLSLGGIEWLRKIYKLNNFELKNFPYCQYDYFPSTIVSDETIRIAAQKLSEENIIGWYQEHGEIGPRALGNRSILFDPRVPNGKFIVNQLKKRENYRPFGASILAEHAHEYFDDFVIDDYMIFCNTIKSKHKSLLSSIVHVDNTCRVQFVHNDGSSFRKLLEQFYKITGCPILLNTSLNLAGKPLAGRQETAMDIFLMNDLKNIFIGNEFSFKY
jgi:carbamoyltransferase